MAKEPKERLILFDVDGVIVDSFDILYRAISHYLRTERQVELTPEDYRAAFEKNPLRTILRKAGIRPTKALAMWPKLSQAMFAHYEQAPIVAGMNDVLQTVAESATLAVVTSSPVDLIEHRFGQAGIDEFFAAYLGAETSMFKDKKIKIALKEFEAIPEETFFITDTAGDINEAKKTDVKTVAVTWGYHPLATLEKVSPDYIVETPAALLTLLSANL